MSPILYFLIAALQFIQLVHAGFSSGVKTNIAVYWGQNSYGQASSQQRLSAYCSNTKNNIIPLAFLTGIKTPATNFANAGNNCTVYSGTSLWSCPQLEEDIKTCQSTYSKTILLSLGGSTYSEGGFDSSAAAKSNATNVWNLFGPNTTYANRPFGSAIVDGFDFDFESSTKNTAPFAQQLRDLMSAASSTKSYFLSAAPQCPYPDTAQNDILTNVALDFVMVQFYNNYCGASSFTQGTTSQANFNMDTWNTWAKSSKNTNVKVFLGVLAGSGAGSGYVNSTSLASVISYCRTFSNFGGVAMWDMSQMVANTGFLDGVYSALTTTAASTTSASSTKASTSTTSKSTTSSKTSSSPSSSKVVTTTSASSSSKATTTSTTTSSKPVSPSSKTTSSVKSSIMITSTSTTKLSTTSTTSTKKSTMISSSRRR